MENTDKTDNTETEGRENELLEKMYRMAERMEAKMSREQRVNMLTALIYSIALLTGGKLKPGKVLTMEDMRQHLTNILEAGGFVADFSLINRKENA